MDVSNQAETEALAVKIGGALRGGEIIELVGDVGSGKTTFTRALVAGTGSNDIVTSPTFTVNNIYTTPTLKICHYDFYRLDDIKIIQAQLEEVLEDKTAVCVLEWADPLQDTLGLERIIIEFEVTGEESRELRISVPKKYKYITIPA